MSLRSSLSPRRPLTGAVLVSLIGIVALFTVIGIAHAGPEDTPRTKKTTKAPRATASTDADRAAPPDGVTLPPTDGANFDYQISEPYAPPSGVEIVSRDREAPPAPGLYNICYVNAFQAQPDAEGDWDSDLLLRDANGDVVIDEDWDEALLDIGTEDKRERIADTVGGWIDGCAEDGFQAVEPDNYDSYTRSQDLLTEDDAMAFIKLLADRAHAAHLAIGQKNTLELASHREKLGLDFAIAEECGQQRPPECGGYTEAFSKVIMIEYEDSALEAACAGRQQSGVAIVRRDVEVSTPDSDGYVRRTCAAV
ncbi:MULTISPECIES: endo alpha-1,4 polygalactosaminidase [unclassified Streptomyces]|uniref:endo alpha-1,4 polygalactosaminidase n=1 Tax=unclassified Streptomyces TaxID=2593676 RepID=UPI00336A8D5A